MTFTVLASFLRHENQHTHNAISMQAPPDCSCACDYTVPYVLLVELHHDLQRHPACSHGVVSQHGEHEVLQALRGRGKEAKRGRITNYYNTMKVFPISLLKAISGIL